MLAIDALRIRGGIGYDESGVNARALRPYQSRWRICFVSTRSQNGFLDCGGKASAATPLLTWHTAAELKSHRSQALTVGEGGRLAEGSETPQVSGSPHFESG